MASLGSLLIHSAATKALLFLVLSTALNKFYVTYGICEGGLLAGFVPLAPPTDGDLSN